MTLLDHSPRCSAQDDVADYFRHLQGRPAPGPSPHLRALWGWVRRAPLAPALAAAQDTAGNDDEPLDVLIVDDQPETVEPVLLLLRRLGHRARCVTSAAAAMAALAGPHPRLILLDVSMPQVDGLEFLRTLRGAPSTRRLPVAMLTADPARGRDALGLGADDCITKPVDFKLLRVRLDKLLP